MSTKNIGERAEELFHNIAGNSGLVLEKTRASGASRGDGDFIYRNFLFDVKYKNKQGFGINKKEFEKVLKQGSRFCKNGVIISVNKNNEVTATLRADVLMDVLSAIENLEKELENLNGKEKR